MPLYVKANNPFDYENPKDVKNVVDYIFANNKTQKGEFASEEGLKAEFIDIENKAFTKKTLSDLLLDKKRIENWDYIENPTVQKAIKNLGYDAFYVKENGVKNLGLFDAKQLKSAIGNKGTFDPTSANILRGAAVTPVAPAVMQDEEKK
jgi:CDP-glycerol glycerophosphotransferase (TagB/SpsB family)